MGAGIGGFIGFFLYIYGGGGGGGKRFAFGSFGIVSIEFRMLSSDFDRVNMGAAVIGLPVNGLKL